MSDLPDEVIMGQVRNGDLAGLAILFERYHVKLYNFMLKLTNDRAASLDLTQNLFYRVLKYRHTYRDGYSFRSWIYEMARNAHHDYFRQKNKTLAKHIPIEGKENEILEPETVFTEEAYSRLDLALNMLNPDQKEMIVLSRFQGLKYEEISTLFNSSVPAIKVQIHRAIKQLRTFYFKLT
jgi:RNA polymerase sigma-70 factor (ECF subfamily)